MNNICRHSLFVAVIGTVFITMVGCDNTKREIVVEGPTNVLARSECVFTTNAKVIAVLNKGDKVRVLGEQGLKDCKVFKIKLADDRVGYVTLGDKFRAFEYYSTTVFAVIEDSTNVMSMPDSVGVSGNTVMAVLHKGEEARTISKHYWKRATYYSIMLDDGRIGYLKWDDKFSLVKQKE